MGNNHGHSKGCSTCVKRRVKCDERHPKCLRCESGRFQCGGYRGATFINATKHVTKRCSSARKKVSRSSSLAMLHTTNACSQIHGSTKTNTSTALGMQISDSTAYLGCTSMAQSILAHREEVYVMYTMKNLCRGPLGVVYCNSIPFCLFSPRPEKMMMNHCLLALAKIYFGFRTGAIEVLQDGLRLYGQGLRMINDALDDFDRNITTETIVSVFALSLGESMIPSSRNSWMVHILGLERLFAARGPLTVENSSILDRALLESFRPVMILGSFFTRRPSLMSKREWNPRRQPHDPGATSDFFFPSTGFPGLSCLMQLLAQLPALFLERTECLRPAKKAYCPHESASKLWTGIVRLHERLQYWKRSWDEDHEPGVHEVVPDTKVPSVRTVPWITIFDFEDINVANAFVTYHVVMILLTSVPLSLKKAGLHSPFQSLYSFDERHLITDMETSSIAICRSLENHVQLLRASQDQRDFHVFFPVHVVRRALTHMGRQSELAWLEDVFKMMLSQTGLGIWGDIEISDDFIGWHEGLFQ